MEEKTKQKAESSDGEDKRLRKDDKEKLADEMPERSYYYDDAHGYEVYDPENDDGEDD